MKAHKFVGLANPVYLPDDIQVEIAIVPSSVYNVRSNQKRGAAEVTSFTVHETANYNAGANADMHKRWLHSGAGGAYVGFNLVVDDKKLIQLTPFDEVTWAAGTPGGNRTSDHLEICVNSDINHTKARRNGAAIAAGVLKARGISINSGLVQHNMWTRKNCPALMRANNNAIWNNTFVPMVKEFYSGSTPDPFEVGTRVKATDRLNVRQGYGTDYTVTHLLEVGDEAEIIADNSGRTTAYADGYVWANIAHEAGSGWAASNWLEPTGEPAPPPTRDTFTTRYELPFRKDDYGFNAAITATLPVGTTGKILSGPEMRDGIGWYRADVNGHGEGWLPASILRTLDIEGGDV